MLISNIHHHAVHCSTLQGGSLDLPKNGDDWHWIRFDSLILVYLHVPDLHVALYMYDIVYFLVSAAL